MKVDKRIIEDIFSGIETNILNIKYALDCEHIYTCNGGSAGCVGCGNWFKWIDATTVELNIKEKEK